MLFRNMEAMMFSSSTPVKVATASKLLARSSMRISFDVPSPWIT
jgi:hypothetical protein